MILRQKEPAPFSQALHAAGLAFLQALDDVEPTDADACEKAVHSALRRASAKAALTPFDVWRAALEIERDPLERLRPAVGPDWQPNLT